MMLPSFSGADVVPADLAECNTNFTWTTTRASCPGFNLTFGVYTYEGKPLTEISNEETNQTVTTTWLAVRDIVALKEGDEQGEKLCFPKATATITENQYPNGTSDSTVKGNVLMNIDGTEYINGVGATLPDVGAVYQEEGSVTAAMDADGITTFIKADGTYMNVCELLSPTPVPADISECNKDFTPITTVGTRCPGFDVTVGLYTYEGKPLTEIGTEKTNQTLTTIWQAVRDIVVYKTGDEQGEKLCFPKATATITENQYPDGTSESTVKGNALINIDGTEYINGVGPTLPGVGNVYQIDGSHTVAVDADGITTYTKADGTHMNVCDLLSGSAAAVETSSSTTAAVTRAAWFVSVLIMLSSTCLFL